MSLLSKLFGSKKKSTPKKKVFTLMTWEAHCVGEAYKYEIEAESKEEAFRKLVNMFYGDFSQEGIKSSSGNISYPLLSRFGYEGMPKWFAKRISGEVRGKGFDNQKKLEEYCRENNIMLKT